MRTATCVALTLLVSVARLPATPPSPQGLVIDWSRIVPANYSNLVYFAWMKPPGGAPWQQLTMTGDTSYTNPVAGPAGTIFGVTAFGRSNLLWVSLDLGFGAWWPDLTATNQVRLTAKGPWTVPTNTWLRKSTDLKTFTQRERFHYGPGGTVLIEHYEHPAEPNLFFDLQPIAAPPLPGK